MIWVAQWLAKMTWGLMLRFMRLPRIKAFPRQWLEKNNTPKRRAAYENHLRQNRFARKHGLRILTWMYAFLVFSLFATVAYTSALALARSGVIPTNLSARG